MIAKNELLQMFWSALPIDDIQNRDENCQKKETDTKRCDCSQSVTYIGHTHQEAADQVSYKGNDCTCRCIRKLGFDVVNMVALRS